MTKQISTTKDTSKQSSLSETNTRADTSKKQTKLNYRQKLEH